MAAGLRNKGLSATVLLGGLAALLALGLVWPLADLAGLVVSEGVDAASFLTPYNLRSIVNTVVMGAAVAFAATVLGFIVSYAITATRVPGRGALKVLFLAPLFEIVISSEALPSKYCDELSGSWGIKRIVRLSSCQVAVPGWTNPSGVSIIIAAPPKLSFR